MRLALLAIALAGCAVTRPVPGVVGQRVVEIAREEPHGPAWRDYRKYDGTKPTRFEGVCISGAGGGSAPIIPVPPAPGGGAKIVNNPNGFDTVNGVPCTPEHYGVCYGMAQNG